MIAELYLEAWIKAQLAACRAEPRLLEYLFYDDSHAGQPTFLDEDVLEDTAQHWLPNYFAPLSQQTPSGIIQATGFVYYGEQLFPILSNTETTLTVTGNPANVEDTTGRGYRIVPPAAVRLFDYFANHTIPVVQTTYAQLPAEFPTFAIELGQEMQGEAYYNEAHDWYNIEGTEYHLNTTQINSQYIIGVWAANPLECTWLYGWLLNRYEADIQHLGKLGVTHLDMRGTSIHPVAPFMPERGYVKYFTLAMTRPERGLNIVQLEPINRWTIEIHAQYARLLIRETLPPVEGG